MMPDYPLGETLDFKFTTRDATGLPTALSSGAVEVYEDNSVTQITAGETLTASFDGVTGLNNLRVVATGGNGYESGKSYHAVLSGGTVGGVSVVGEVVAQFSIERSPALRPTTAGRTLDVATTGEAGVDLGNVTGTLGNGNVGWVDGNNRVDVGQWLGTAVTSGTGGPDVNVNAISDDTGAAANLEADYDGTGYVKSFSTIANVIDLVNVPDVNVTRIGGSVTSGTDLKDFVDDGYDPITNKVQGVVLVDTTTTNTDMRGTDGANTTTPPTAVAIRTEIDSNSTQLTAIKAVTDALTAAAAAKLKTSAGTIIEGTIDTAGFTPTVTEFEADDITEATADHYNGRIVIFTSGALNGQARAITDYSLATGRGHFTVSALTDAAANNDTFVIL